MKRISVILLMITALSQTRAQELSELTDSIPNTNTQNEKVFKISGYGRASIYAGSKNFDMAAAFAEISLQPSIEKWNAFLKSDLRVRTGYFFNEYQNILQVKELYVGYRHDKFSVLLGNQIVNWGRTDGFNPTNNITPNDYFFLSANPNDQKMSNFMLKFNYRPVSGINLELIGIPFYKMSNYRFDLFDLNRMSNINIGAMLGMSSSTVDLTPNIIFYEDVSLTRNLKSTAIAFRADFDFSAFGGSISCFHGYDPYHGIELRDFNISTGRPELSIVSLPYKKTTIGADFAIPAGNFIIRGEVAYNIINKKNNWYNKVLPNSDLSYVVGLEINVGGFIILPQYIGKYTFDLSYLSEPIKPIQPTLTDPTDSNAVMRFEYEMRYYTGKMMDYASKMADYQFRNFNRKIFNQQEDWNHAVSLTLTKSFAYDQLSAELTGYYNFTSEEFMIRPCLTWKINDLLSLTAGGIYMYGKENSLYNFSSKTMNGGFVEFKISF